MLDDLGYAVPDPNDKDAAWALVLRAFGYWNLPLEDFYSPFLQRLPAWEEQDALDRQLNLLLDEFDHCPDPAAKREVVSRMRATVREAFT